MYITCKKSTVNLRLIDNLIVSPDTSTVHGDLCWLTGLQTEAAIDWLRAISDWLVYNVATRISTSYLKI
jgi:predicted ribonuclease YlaK